MKKLAMHWKILIGMIVGLLFGLLMKNLEQKGLLLIKPFGTIFINLQNDCGSINSGFLIVGLADLKDISKLSKLGGRTVLFYLCSTVVAVTIGLGLANLIKPGRFINKESRESLIQNFSVDASQKIEMAASAKRMVLFNRLLISFQIIFSKL
jgi:Na+/H+-dicarboxylate symporter